eukprot:scaffold18570_cov71-Phaeocystis_antarctica.AAC.5
MSQKWPSRGPKRTFLPLRGLSKEWAFHCEGGSARKNEPRFFGVFTLSYLFAAPFQIQSLGLSWRVSQPPGSPSSRTPQAKGQA